MAKLEWKDAEYRSTFLLDQESIPIYGGVMFRVAVRLGAINAIFFSNETTWGRYITTSHKLVGTRPVEDCCFSSVEEAKAACERIANLLVMI